jgi:hypothetical protein
MSIWIKHLILVQSKRVLNKMILRYDQFISPPNHAFTLYNKVDKLLWSKFRVIIISQNFKLMVGLCFKCSFKILNVLEDSFGFEKHNKFFQLYLSINVKILNISMRYVLHGVTHIKLDLNDNSWITTLPLLLLMKKTSFV